MRPDELLPPPPPLSDRPLPGQSLQRRPRRDRPRRRRTVGPRTVTAVTLALGAGTVAAVTGGPWDVPVETAASVGSDGPQDAPADHGDSAPLQTDSAGLDGWGPDTVPAPVAGAASRPEATGSGEVQRLAEQRNLLRLDGVAGDTGGDLDTEVSEVPPAYVAADGEVIDAERIFGFLDGRGAPLAEHAETIVAAGIAHDVDPRVVVAIAIAESDGAKMKPAGTHNAWGWGGSGGPRGLRAWGSWEESIDAYTERLGVLYDTDNVDWEFASTYCPPNTRWWFDTVTWAIGAI